MNLVTGATGIIGSHVTYTLLKKGEAVVAVKRSTSNLTDIKNLFHLYEGNDVLFSRIKWIELDLQDVQALEAAMQNIETVYHCAGMVSFNDKDFTQLKANNEIATANVVNACIYKGVKTLCYVSSLSTINNNDYLGELNEAVFWKTSGSESAYGISKYNAEREVWRGMEEGLNAVIVNPGVVLSPFFWNQSSGRIFKFCSKGSIFYPPGKTGYIAAKDVAEIMVNLVHKKIVGERFILIEKMYRFQEIFTIAQKAFGKSAPKIKANKFILNIARLGDALLSALIGKKRTITRASVNSALSEKTYSNQKLNRFLPFNYTSVEAEIKFICDAFLKKPD